MTSSLLDLSPRSKETAKAAVCGPWELYQIQSPSNPLFAPICQNNGTPREAIQMANLEQQKKLESLSLTKEVIATLTPQLQDLTTLGIDETVLRALRDVGLACLVDHAEVPTYNSATREFVSSFESITEESRVVGWRFRLGNMTFERTRSDLCHMLGLRLDGVTPVCSVDDRSTLMRMISPFDRFANFMTPQNIQDLAWKYLHRIVALAINPRMDGGRYITLGDMDILVHMSRGVTVDWFGVLTARFRDWGETFEKNRNAPQVFGGGLFVTRIAIALGFDMTTAGHPLYHRLTIQRVIAFKMIRSDRTVVFSDRLVAKCLSRLGSSPAPIIRPVQAAEAPADFDIPVAEAIPLVTVQTPPFNQTYSWHSSDSLFAGYSPRPDSPQSSVAGGRSRARPRSTLARRMSRLEQTLEEMQTRTAADSQGIIH